jgi:hypothetical protein
MWEFETHTNANLRVVRRRMGEELKAAQAARAVINVLSAVTPKTAISATLRRANLAAIRNLGKGGALNEARINAGLAISNLIDGSPTPERVDKAKVAIDAWIRELEAAGA